MSIPPKFPITFLLYAILITLLQHFRCFYNNTIANITDQITKKRKYPLPVWTDKGYWTYEYFVFLRKAYKNFGHV
jgi:hypothetical protein